jgi:site-specific DNA-cytosine methylase
MRTHLDLFSGIGGFALAAAANNVQTTIFCEKDEHCRNFLKAEWGLPVVPDVRDFDGTKWRGAWLLTAGVPCQPASRAGKQLGAADDRWLWPEALRVLEEAKPDCCIFENPPGILDMDFDGILSEMERIGYEVQPFDIPACAVNSPQLRHRIWIVGCLGDTARQQRAIHERGQRKEAAHAGGATGHMADAGRQHSGQDQQERGAEGGNVDRRDCKNDMANAASAGCERPDSECGQDGRSAEHHSRHMADTERERRDSGTKQQPAQQAENRQRRLAGNGQEQWSRYVWTPCGDGKLRRAPDESLDVVTGLHRSLLSALGNSIVPQIPAILIQCMLEAERQITT